MAPLHHIVRIRQPDDFDYIRPGLMDEVVVNANQLENSVQSTAAVLWNTSLPFSVDPILWRFQLPQWSRNGKGDTKRNYKRLGAEYARGTGLVLGPTPLLDTVSTDDQWRTLAGNVAAYQRDRLLKVPTQLELLDDLRELHPSRLVAPALVALSDEEDRINRLMFDAASENAGQAIGAQVIVPVDRLTDRGEVDAILASIPTDGVSSYLLWTPQVTEERLITDDTVLASLIRIVATLADRGIAVGHQYANYTVFALRSAGLAAVTHHLGWTDHGEPAEEQGPRPRSCQMYVPGVRHAVRGPDADRLGRPLTPAEYVERFCECGFCAGAFEDGMHPLDILLQSQTITIGGHDRQTPTSQAVGANTWHYLLSRRLEVETFSVSSTPDVIARDIERAAALNRDGDVNRLTRLARQLPAA